jgi:hypothetical protein
MARALFILSLLLVVAVAPLPGRVRAALAAVLVILAGGVYYLSVEQERAHAAAEAEAARVEGERWSEGGGAANLERVSFETPLFFGDYATVDFRGAVRGEGPRVPTRIEVRVAALDCPAPAVSEGCVPAGEVSAVLDLVTGLPDAPRTFATRLRFDGLRRPAGVLRFEPQIERVRY